MISEKRLGAYASIASLPPAEQADWYRKIAGDLGISTFEFPFLAGVSLPDELVEAFTSLPASLVVTLVAQWATTGQVNARYGLSSTDESSRQAAVMDTCAILQQCASLSGQGVRIRNVVVHTGQRCGESIPHAIALNRSLTHLRELISAVMPDTTLAVEPSDNLPLDHPIPFPAAKKSSLSISELIHVVSTVNQQSSTGHPVALMINWGRLQINGDAPLSGVYQVLESDVPLAGVILSGAGHSPDGYRDSHNSHLDPDSGFTEAEAEACAAALNESPQPTFIGMKCSRAKGDGELTVDEVISAQADLLNRLG